MAKEEIAYTVSVDTKASGKSLSDLKKEFKETQKELSNLTEGTKEYYDSLKKLGTIKDDIGDLNDTINSFKPDQKLKAFGNTIALVGQGFAAAQGAIGLFGSESKELEKTMLKVQSAMAMSQAIQGLQNLGDTLSLLKSSLMQTAIGTKIVTAAQWLWNAAMNANPIALIIAGIAALATAFTVLANSTEDAAAKQQRMNELEQEHLVLLDKYVEAIEKKNRILIDSTKFELEMLKKRGATEEEIYAKEKEIAEKRRQQLMYIKGFRGQLNAEESKELLELTQREILLSIERVKKIKDKREEQTKHAIEQQRKEREEFNKEYSALLTDKERLDKQFDDKVKENKAKEKAKADEEEAIRLEVQYNKSLEAEEKRKEAIELKEQQDRESFERTIALAQATNQSMVDLSNLLFDIKRKNLEKGSARELAVAKKQFQVNKALAITSNVISTIMGVTNALSAQSVVPDPFGTILKVANAAAVGISGTVATAKIASQKFNEGTSSAGGGGGGLPSLPTPNIAPPSQGSTQLNPDGTIKQNTGVNTTIKAVVVETDITKTQKKVGSIETNAKL